jgi:hypothetical protein
MFQLAKALGRDSAVVDEAALIWTAVSSAELRPTRRRTAHARPRRGAIAHQKTAQACRIDGQRPGETTLGPVKRVVADRLAVGTAEIGPATVAGFAGGGSCFCPRGMLVSPYPGFRGN